MKKIIVLCSTLIMFVQLNAQINGNGIRTTQTRTFQKLDKILININGQVDIISGADENKIEISYDENIVDYVSTDRSGDFIELGQKKWIEGTKEVAIVIYTKELKALYNDSWSKVNVSNLDQSTLEVESSISKVKLSGRVDELEISSKKSIIDAYDLSAQKVEVKITKNGKVYVNANESLKAKIKEDGIVKYSGNPSIIEGLSSAGIVDTQAQSIDTKFIKLKIKNNSFRRIHGYVKGPKPDGNYFSYGLNFFPMATKEETWSIGTKLYKKNMLGTKTLIYEVKAEDEGQVVKLF